MGFFSLSAFANVPPPPVNEQVELTKIHDADPYEQKVNLTTEEYKDRNGDLWVLPVVRQTELELIMDTSLTHGKSTMWGNGEFIKAAQDMLFGTPSAELRSKVASIQTVSGTGACHIGAKLLCDSLKPNTIWTLPDRSGVDFDGMINALKTRARRNDVICLHSCAHSSSGLDLTLEQWVELGKVCQKIGIFPFFDSAYQGFASGDPDADVWAIRCFVELGLEVCVAQSFSRSFGLSGERVGCLHVVLNSSAQRQSVFGRLYHYQRGLTSTPPTYGANIVSTILTSESLYRAWRIDLKSMTDRIQKLRLGLYNELIKRRVPGSWEYLLIQRGMFAHTKLSKQQVELLRTEYHIYIMSTGRISLPALNAQNIEWVAGAINEVVTRFSLEEKANL
ncbi:aspartate aminotransferase cytoplasmic [Penicillium brevicompactum]|uniref:aspartate aminotransferase cytoplasmic n=1 Tax=Penicillium brevicompactum TaxID=5074 RepID=UPI00253FDDA4|nr:aspartate aminotransferase cytoplasmic [Penicillium brevicompactum]KAJ5325336.1 aspartate aminotransferase cytoplasmic [Penicillium brevicompactum]